MRLHWPATEYFLQGELESGLRRGDGRVKRKRFTEEQVIAVFRDEAGAKTADLARKIEPHHPRQAPAIQRHYRASAS
jgi:hypothetical protein